MPVTDLRRSMLAASAAARPRLGDAADRVADFFAAQHHADGGFRGRGRHSDLYYTAFGMAGLLALERELPSDLAGYLAGFAAGDDLDLVHHTCLVRCWCNLVGEVPAGIRDAARARLEAWRSGDGGYHPDPGAPRGSLYGAFLAAGARQDLGLPPEDESLSASIAACRTPDGGYGDLPGQAVGITTLTAGAITLQRLVGAEPDAAALAWLRTRLTPAGGFGPSAEVALPDLLSTATALHALADAAGRVEAAIRDPCLRFLDTVWDEDRAGFCGHALDRTVDVEYTWYGLFALGHLG